MASAPKPLGVENPQSNWLSQRMGIGDGGGVGIRGGDRVQGQFFPDCGALTGGMEVADVQGLWEEGRLY